MTRVLIDRATLEQLVVALKDAQRSLETISMLAGRATYGNPPIETFMQHPDEIRGYAASRAGCATEAITEGSAALANAEPTRWQPIETAPKDGTSFMAGWFDGPSNPGCNMRPVKRYMGAWWESNEDYKVRTPTHWMPLPAAPKEQP